jgi:carbonic anhydrase
MKKLIEGLRDFKSDYYSSHQEMFELLSHGQKPRVLFIACSDSRIVPNLITHTEPGELFVIRNAGNMIPPFGAANGGEGAAVEYAIHALGIEQIVVCGHSHCGAMKGLLSLNKLQEDMPLVYDWLKHAEATRRLVKENYKDYKGEELLEITIAENVLTQIENLKTYPVVRSRMLQGKMHIFGWVYHIESGEVLAYDPETHTYVAPQTQLPPHESWEPGQYTQTSAPPVACEWHSPHYPASSAPTKAEKVSPRQAKSSSSRTQPQPRQPINAKQPINGSSNGKDGNGNGLGTGWLPPEQADRIFRGRS